MEICRQESYWGMFSGSKTVGKWGKQDGVEGKVELGYNHNEGFTGVSEAGMASHHCPKLRQEDQAFISLIPALTGMVHMSCPPQEGVWPWKSQVFSVQDNYQIWTWLKAVWSVMNKTSVLKVGSMEMMGRHQSICYPSQEICAEPMSANNHSVNLEADSAPVQPWDDGGPRRYLGWGLVRNPGPRP